MTGTVAAVVLDLFGTLVPEGPAVGWREQMRLMAAPLGVPADVFARYFVENTPNRMTGRLTVEDDVRSICAEVGCRVDDEQVAASVAARTEALRDWLTPRDDTLPALRALHTAGLPLALVTDCSPDTEPLWPQTPMAPYFDATVFSSRLGTRKPDPLMYLTACEAVRMAPEQCMYVGDGNSNELTGATAVGMRAVHLDVERPRRQDPAYEGATWTGERVTSLAEIPALLGL